MPAAGDEALSGSITRRHALAGAVGVAEVGGLLFASSDRGHSVLPFTLAALAGLGALVVLERRQPLLRRSFVLGLIGLLLVAAVLIPPRRSHDVWQYAMYGRMVAAHDASPYTHVPSEFSDDAAYARIDPIWRNTYSLYGPGFTILSGGIARATGTAELPTRLAYQGLAAAAVGLAALLVDRRTRDPMAVLLVVANPAVIAWAVNGAHNDTLVGLGLLAAVLLAERRRAAWAGAAIGAAILVKAVAVLALIPLAWWLWHQRRQSGDADPAAAPAARADESPWRAPAVATVVAGLASLAGFAVGGGRDAVARLAHASGNTSWESFWRPVAIWSRDDPKAYVLDHTTARLSTVIVVVVVLLCAAAWSTDRSPALVVASALVAYLLGAPYTVVWYLAWVVPLLCLRWRSRVNLLVLTLSAIVLLAAEGPGDTRGITAEGFTWLVSGLRVFELVALAALGAAAATALLRRRRSTREPGLEPTAA